MLTANVFENIHCNVHLARYLAHIKRFDSLCSSCGFYKAVIPLNFVTANLVFISPLQLQKTGTRILSATSFLVTKRSVRPAVVYTGTTYPRLAGGLQMPIDRILIV